MWYNLKHSKQKEIENQNNTKDVANKKELLGGRYDFQGLL